MRANIRRAWECSIRNLALLSSFSLLVGNTVLLQIVRPLEQLWATKSPSISLFYANT